VYRYTASGFVLKESWIGGRFRRGQRSARRLRLAVWGIGMTEIGQETPDPASFAGGVLNPHRHVCEFVNSRDEEHRILDPFGSEGLACGERLLYFVDSGERANLVRHFRHLGFDLPTLLGRSAASSGWRRKGGAVRCGTEPRAARMAATTTW
jgi:hypothetical protein